MEKFIFLAVGKILVLLAVFFFLNFNSKSIENLIFLAFGKILVLLLLVFFVKFLLRKPSKFHR